MLYSPEEEKSQGRGSAEHGQRFWLLWDRCGFSPSDQSRPQGFDLPPASPRDQKRRGKTKHASLFLVTEQDSETTPTRLRAVPSHCPQAPLAASATWLAAKRLDREELSRRGRSCAAGAVLRGQVSVGRTCLCSAALGGAALGKISLERSQVSSSSLHKTGSGGGRADPVQTSLLQTRTGTGQRGLGPSPAAPWAWDGGKSRAEMLGI